MKTCYVQKLHNDLFNPFPPVIHRLLTLTCNVSSYSQLPHVMHFTCCRVDRICGRIDDMRARPTTTFRSPSKITVGRFPRRGTLSGRPGGRTMPGYSDFVGPGQGGLRPHRGCPAGGLCRYIGATRQRQKAAEGAWRPRWRPLVGATRPGRPDPSIAAHRPESAPCARFVVSMGACRPPSPCRSAWNRVRSGAIRRLQPPCQVPSAAPLAPHPRAFAVVIAQFRKIGPLALTPHPRAFPVRSVAAGFKPITAA